MSAPGQRRRIDNKPWRDLWATPRHVVESILDTLNIGIHLDVCASEENRKAERWLEGPCVKDEPLFAGACMCGLCSDWMEYSCWMNPPGSVIGLWMAKARLQATHGATVVCLVPNATDTTWFRRSADQATRVLLFEKRIQYEEPEERRLIRLAEGIDDDTGSSMGNAVIVLEPPAARPPRAEWGYID